MQNVPIKFLVKKIELTESFLRNFLKQVYYFEIAIHRILKTSAKLDNFNLRKHIFCSIAQF